MRRWIGKIVFLTFSLPLALPLTATAQDTQGKLGVGLSFLGDDGGVGVTVDYSKAFHSLAKNKSFGWVPDFSFHGNDVGDSGIEVDLKSFTFQGGIRLTGPFGANERLTWHAQGLLGVMHVTAGADSLLEDICDAMGSPTIAVGIGIGDHFGVGRRVAEKLADFLNDALA